jgi:UDP-N-acetylmuramoyl-tripeptide--D-alanyl-D-alanine ligase
MRGMSVLWAAQEIVAATGGAAHGDFEVSGVAFDSREIGAGDLFIALKGETTDGHRFVDQAFAGGAAGAMVVQEISHSYVRVEYTAAALYDLGRAARARTKG